VHSVAFGSWLCQNAKTLNDYRRSYSSKTALGHQLAIAFHLRIELKNVILVAFGLLRFHTARVTSVALCNRRRPVDSAMPRLRPMMRGGAICREGPKPEVPASRIAPFLENLLLRNKNNLIMLRETWSVASAPKR
jgi:hypothetical protein